MQDRHRISLLTDAMPNVGNTGTDNFLDLATSHAELGIGLTVIGVGLNFGQELALSLSEIRGANDFFLEDVPRLLEIFDLDFPFWVTPLAYDLSLLFQPQPGFEIADVFGVPGRDDDDTDPQMNVTTVFLSRNRGAILLRLTETGDTPPRTVSQ